VSFHPHRHPRRVGAGDAAAENHHLGRRHTRHSAKQHAETALLLFEAMGTDLHRHAASNLAHRRQQRQAAARIGHCLIGDRDDT